jgi:hypothetical protein
LRIRIAVSSLTSEAPVDPSNSIVLEKNSCSLRPNSSKMSRAGPPPKRCQRRMKSITGFAVKPLGSSRSLWDEEARSSAEERKRAAEEAAAQRTAAAKQADDVAAQRKNSAEAAKREEQARIRANEQKAAAAAESKPDDAQARRRKADIKRAHADRVEELAGIEKQKRQS